MRRFDEALDSPSPVRELAPQTAEEHYLEAFLSSVHESTALQQKPC